MSEKSEMVRERVVKARQIQADRFKENKGVYSNSQMSSKTLRIVCKGNYTEMSQMKTEKNWKSICKKITDYFNVPFAYTDLFWSDVLVVGGILALVVLYFL
jgi:predicted ATPase with chaperone activity